MIVGDVRSVGLGVVPDPNPESEKPHPRDVAHALVVDCDMPKRANKLAREFLAERAVIVHVGAA